MVMQMLAAGGIEILTDGSREADEDNPRGYFELDRVKNLLNDAEWLREAGGKAVKIVVPLVAALPQNLACKVILIERDLEEVLDSQQRMLARRRSGSAPTGGLRRKLKEEYGDMLARAKRMLERRPATEVLVLDYGRAIADPSSSARAVANFLGGAMDPIVLAAAIDPSLRRTRAV